MRDALEILISAAGGAVLLAFYAGIVLVVVRLWWEIVKWGFGLIL